MPNCWQIVETEGKKVFPHAGHAASLKAKREKGQRDSYPIYNADSQNVLIAEHLERETLAQQPNEGYLEVKREKRGSWCFLGGTSDCCIVHGMGLRRNFGVFLFSCMHSATLDMMYRMYWDESN